ncbi:TetR/AcrR family transcriptional regulator, partial [Nonomuraea wenchangensis]|uniref:TetR/AcrR family transcriptional regulator n=1 Tax=Nonomuraea wenchangensis TaxID=568860 RepID=UPI0033235D60
MAKQPDPARRSQRSRQAILTAARELITEMGYAKLSIEAIAARAGVGKQTIYRWWPSKGAVVLDAFLALSEAGPEQDMALPDTGDLEADLKVVMRATVAEFADPAFEAPIRALNTEIINDPALAAQYQEKLAGPVDEGRPTFGRGTAEAQMYAVLNGQADLKGVPVELL